MKAAPISSNFQGPNVPRFTRFVPWTAAAAPTQPRPASRRPSRRCWSWTQRGRGAPQRCRAGSLKRPLGRPLDFSRWGKDFSWIFGDIFLKKMMETLWQSDPRWHFPFRMVGLGPPINQFLWFFWCRRGTPFCRKRPVCTHPTSLYMRTRSYASVRHLHFVEDLEYHFVDGYGELINTSTNVNIFEHKKISTAFGWLSSAGRFPQALELADCQWPCCAFTWRSCWSWDWLGKASRWLTTQPHRRQRNGILSSNVTDWDSCQE